MKYTITIFLVLLLGLLLVWPTPALAQESGPSAEPRTRDVPTPIPGIALYPYLRGPRAIGRHALLIGVQDYDYHPNLPSLAGSRNDLTIVENTLRTRFGFQDGNFLILEDAEATHTHIAQAFQTLIATVAPGDFVYIHYSGHGSQTVDLNGDEPDDKLDETWVSYGARSAMSEGNDQYDVLDDEVNSWLSALYATTHHVVFVSDSCHSATVSRGESVSSRAVGADERPHPLGTLEYTQPGSHPGVRIGSARDRESAIEVLMPDNQYYGLFTWHWIQSLQQAQTGETWNNVFKRVNTQVTAERGTVQRPQFEGARSLQLEGYFSPTSATIPVTDVDGELVTIQAGYLSGVTPGSVYRVYAANPPDPQSLPTVTITRVRTFTSLGQADGSITTGDLLVEESHAYTFAPFQVYVAADYAETIDHDLLHALRKLFSPVSDTPLPLPAYTLTDDPQQADLHVYILHPKQENGRYLQERDDVLPTSFPQQPPEVWVLSPEHRLLYDNLRMPFDDLERGMQMFRDNLNKLARIRELKALRAPRTSTLHVDVDIHRFSPVATCQGEADCLALPNDLGFFRQHAAFPFADLDGRTYRQGEILSFTLHNPSQYDYYCYLLDIAPDGTISAIFPDPEASAEHARVNAGATRDLLDEVGLLADIIGEETIKFIASRQPIDVSLLESEGFTLRGGRNGAFNPLEQLLVNALYGQRSVVRYNIDEWATQQVSFEIDN